MNSAKGASPGTGAKLAVQFRELRSGDMDALYFLHQNHLPPSARRSYGALYHTLLEPGTGAMVAEVQDGGDPPMHRVVGVLIVRAQAHPEMLVLDSLVVEPLFRRRGLGRRLAAWAFRAALARNQGGVVTLLEPGSGESEAFLRALEFEPVDWKVLNPGAPGEAVPPEIPPERAPTPWRRVLAPEGAEENTPPKGAQRKSKPKGAKKSAAPKGAKKSAPKGAKRKPKPKGAKTSAPPKGAEEDGHGGT